jgi:arabinogalactan oligomer/maltooligosaccharide transport system permease protein
MVFNLVISFTNSNQFHPNPDCSIWLISKIDPNCWQVFGGGTAKGVGTPYTYQNPLLTNYQRLLGALFTPSGLLALLVLVVIVAPFFIANQANKYFDRQVSRSVSSLLVWVIALAAAIVLALLLNVQATLNTLMKGSDFFVVVGRTVAFVILTIPINYGLGLLVALLLNNEYIKGRTFFRSLMIIPWAASSMFIIVSLIWQFFFRQQGTVNQILAVFGIQGPAWLNNPTYAFAIILLVNMWFSFPFAFFVILGAMQSIPPEQYEAAEMDGASYWQQLTNITLPLIRPAILPAIVLSAIGAGGFQMFGTVWAITQGGPSRGAGVPGATELVMVYVYKQVSQLNQYARAGAFAMLIFIFLIIMTFYSLRLTRITKGAYE